MSPNYLRSQWCQDEAQTFSDFARDFRPVERQDRIFVASVAPTERKAWPPALRDDDQNAFVGAKFYRDLGPELWQARLDKISAPREDCPAEPERRRL
jgi:hypothetical protein